MHLCSNIVLCSIGSNPELTLFVVCFTTATTVLIAACPSTESQQWNISAGYADGHRRS